ncbi:MAG: GIY-YIG nuclease family protein [Planctomycetota bacterium]
MGEAAGSFWVYILENSTGRFYVGHTDSLRRRVEQHNDSSSAGGRYTAKHGPWRLVWSEEHPSRSAAMAREKQIKSMKSARWIRDHLLNR